MANVIQKHKAIKSLAPERQEKILQMLRKGETADHIAGVIQGNWYALLDVKRESLERAIRRYRSDFVRSNMRQLLVESGAIDKVMRLAKMDVPDELQRLYYIQQTRVDRLVEFENNHPDSLLQSGKGGTYEISADDRKRGAKPGKLRDELRLAADMLLQIARLQ